jgi:hypothetical protein
MDYLGWRNYFGCARRSAGSLELLGGSWNTFELLRLLSSGALVHWNSRRFEDYYSHRERWFAGITRGLLEYLRTIAVTLIGSAGSLEFKKI